MSVIQVLPYPPPRRVPVDVERWSGIPADAPIEGERRTRLRSALEQALKDIDAVGGSNSEKAQARSLLIAIQALSDAPEPPSKQIWRLIEHGLAIFGVAEIFYRIVEAVIS